MKLYLIQRVGAIGYDEIVSQVIRAKDARQARQFANNNSKAEGRIWDNCHFTHITELTHEGYEGTLCINYRNG